jgi:hypothetical protein
MEIIIRKPPLSPFKKGGKKKNTNFFLFDEGEHEVILFSMIMDNPLTPFVKGE